MFFENTFPTDVLRDLVIEVLGRLTGRKPNASAVIRLETAFAGGKTHNLIALFLCVLNGHALGGGFELALVCDLRLA